MQPEKIIFGKTRKVNPEFLENIHRVKDRINAFEKNFTAFENLVHNMKFDGHQSVMAYTKWKTDGM